MINHTTTAQEDLHVASEFCSHGDYVGDDPRICRELLNDDAWLEAVEQTVAEGRDVYLNLADELSGDPRFIEEQADPQFVNAAADFAREHGLPWPPQADIDLALEDVREAGLGRGGRP